MILFFLCENKYNDHGEAMTLVEEKTYEVIDIDHMELEELEVRRILNYVRMLEIIINLELGKLS